MAFDYKKEFKELYLPKNEPALITVPSMNFAAVRGQGDPNREGGAYQTAIGLLYGVAYAVKMSRKGSRNMEGYFDFVVPPLEGLWWMPGLDGMDYSRKSDFHWVSMIRLPDFVTNEDFHWAVGEAARKKGGDYSLVEFITYEEGLCVQCMHLGSYDSEPATVARMEEFTKEQGCQTDFSETRLHHEIYLSDARRCAPEKLRTVIRHPVKKGHS